MSGDLPRNKAMAVLIFNDAQIAASKELAKKHESEWKETLMHHVRICMDLYAPTMDAVTLEHIKQLVNALYKDYAQRMFQNAPRKKSVAQHDTTIILNECEKHLVEWLAPLRHKSNRKAGVSDKQIGPGDSLMTDKLGVAGELAVARYLDCYPDLTISPRSGSYDMRTRYQGLHVDAKGTTCEHGRLLTPLSTPADKADIYVLVITDLTKCEIIGWAYTTKLLRPEQIQDLGHGPTYAMYQADLSKPAGLLSL